METDILSIHTKILQNFQDKKNNLDSFIVKREEIEKLIKEENISHHTLIKLEQELNTLKKLIKDIEEDRSYNFYIMETTPIIEKYKELLKNPVQLCFTGRKNAKTEETEEKNIIINIYLKIARNYEHNIDITRHGHSDVQQNICLHCRNKKFDIVDSNYICTKCGTLLEMLNHASSYKDIERVNITTKYTYDPKIHFRDCINQFQGKQNATISPKVYETLINQFELHSLLKGDSQSPKSVRFENITKDHIYLFLKETGYSKHYEDIVLIYYNITGNKPDDIGYLEPILLQDFDVLTNIYDQIYRKDRKIERKNFINTQYVLFQLLKRHKYPCKKEDFNILKTTDRQSFHDDICKTLFEYLGWNFTAIF